MLRAALIGAVSAIVGIFLLAGLHGAFFGAPQMFSGLTVFGLEGATTDMNGLVFLGLTFPVVIPAVPLAGAALGILLRGLTRSSAQNGGRG